MGFGEQTNKRIPLLPICGLRARIECKPFSEHSTHSDRVTNIGDLLSGRASTVLLQKSGFYFHKSSGYTPRCFISEIASITDFLSSL